MKPANVLICLDLSAHDAGLVTYVAALARRWEALERVILFHNIRYDFLVNEALETSDYEKLKGAIAKEIGENYRSQFTDAGCEVDVVVREENNSSTAILSARKEYAVDLLVMGRKKQTEGSGHLPFRVVNNDPDGTPLLLVPRKAKARWQHVVAGVDFTAATKRTLRSAAALQQLSPERLTFVHVYQVPNAYFPYLRGQDTEMEQRVRATAERKFAGFRDEIDLSPIHHAEFRLTAGENIAATLREYTAEQDTDLLVIGRWGKENLLGNRVGDVTRKLMVGGGAQVPLLIV